MTLKCRDIAVNNRILKMELKPTKTLSGFIELLPVQQRCFDECATRMQRVLKTAGFTHLDLPAIERAEVLTDKDNWDEIETQMFLFQKGDTKMGLRYDGTVGLSRYVAGHMNDLVFPFRAYQFARNYRGERPQRGRYREFYQMDLDIMGIDALSENYDEYLNLDSEQCRAAFVLIDKKDKMNDFYDGLVETVGKSAADKINAVYQTGVDNLLEDVRNLTGIDVKYYLKVDTEALKVLVDEIGGVYFDVPINMHYTDRGQGLYINLQAGYQKLDGDKAEQVVRFRHNSDGSTYPSEYGGEDLGRMRTQRAFLEAVLKQTIENMDINTIFSFLDIAEKYVETNLDFDVIKDYVPSVLDFNMDNLETATLPGTPEYIGKFAFYTVNEDEVEEVVNKLFYGIEPEIEGNTVDGNTIADEDGVIPENAVKVEVLNGNGSESTLSEVIAKLKNAGFSVIQTGNAKGATNTTVIDRGELTEAETNSLKEIMGVQNITSGESGEAADVTIIIGRDYK